MNTTLDRQWALLQMIPRSPKKTTAKELRDNLKNSSAEGVTIRTIQRDLDALSKIFPLIADNGKPIGWSWHKDAMPFNVPGMDPHCALTFVLVEERMKQALPSATTRHLAPWFEHAKKVIEGNSKVFNWRNKIRFVSKSIPQLQNSLTDKIRDVVYECLLKGSQMEVTYNAITTTDEPKTYPVHPLALFLTDDGIYLRCKKENYNKPITLHLSRILNAKDLNLPVVVPIDYDIDGESADIFQIRLGKDPIKLKLRMSKMESRRLEESPINESQSISLIDDQWRLIEVVTFDSVHLRRWIRSLGSEVFVMKPKEMREELLIDLQLQQDEYRDLAENSGLLLLN